MCETVEDMDEEVAPKNNKKTFSADQIGLSNDENMQETEKTN